MKIDFLHDDEDREHVPFRKIKKAMETKPRHQRYDDEGRREKQGTKQHKMNRRPAVVEQDW